MPKPTTLTLFTAEVDDEIRFHNPAAFKGLTGVVDYDDAVIKGVSLITCDLEAEGHKLFVDKTTLKQLHSLAKDMEQVPVTLDHGGGITSVNGYIDNFRLDGNKLRGDWHLLHSHDETETMLERAERQPGTFGMSVAFRGPPKGVLEGGKACARAEELLSCDCVKRAAANPDGMFSAKPTKRLVDTQKISNRNQLFTFQTSTEPTMPRQNTQNREATMDDVIAAINNLNERFEAHSEDVNSRLQNLTEGGEEGDGEGTVDRDTLEALYNMSPAQLAQFNRENGLKITRAEIEQAVEDFNATLDDGSEGGEEGEGEGAGEGEGEGDFGNQHAEGAGGEGGGATGVEASAAGTQLNSALKRIVQLEARLAKRERAEREEAEQIEFEAVQENFTKLSTQNKKLIEFAKKVEAENEALRIHLQTGTRPVKAGVDTGVRLFHAPDGNLHPFQKRVKEIKAEQKCSEAAAILFASREDSALHADYLLTLTGRESAIHA